MIPIGKIPPELSADASGRWCEFCSALKRAQLALPGDAISPWRRGLTDCAKKSLPAPAMEMNLEKR